MQPLGITFTPGPSDVILGRGKLPPAHRGNIQFQSMIKRQFLDQYSKATNRALKSQIVAEIVSLVRRSSPNGGFVKRMDDGLWYEVGDHLAREKVSQTLRDALDFKYKSASKSKRKKRADVRDRNGPLGEEATLSHVTTDGGTSLPGGSRCRSEVSPELSGKLTLPIAPLAGGIGSAAASGMALTELFLLRRHRPGPQTTNLAPPSPPSNYPTIGTGSLDAVSRTNNGQRHDSSRVGTLPQRIAHQSRSTAGALAGSISPDDFMAACDQLPDSALLNTDPSVLNAYCTIMATIKGNGTDPKDVLLTDMLLRRTIFKE